MRVNDFSSIQEYYENKRNQLLISLPEWTKGFITDNSASFSTRTQIAYIQELIKFLSFVMVEVFKSPCSICDITIIQFSTLTLDNLLYYLNSFNGYINKNGHYIQIGDKALKRRIAIIKSLYNYLYRNGQISNNIAVLLEMPKINPLRECKISNQSIEDAKLIIEGKLYSLRNNTIIHLLKDTGLRIVECVSLNRNDVNFDTCTIKYLRKNQICCAYLSSETLELLKKYVESIPTKDPSTALFLSNRNERISIRMIEVMLKNVSSELDTTIRASSLRQFCATQLFEKIRDPYLVADYLGYSYQGLLLDKNSER